MEPTHEFGKEAMEKRMASIKRNKRNMRAALIIIPLFVISILIISFRTQIKDVLSTTEKAKTSQEKKPGSETAKGDNNISILQRWELPEKLLEISGLSWMDNERFACVQDETGIVFIYNAAKSTIEKEIPFSGAGDYEGLAVVGETVWVIRSDGKLYEINSIKSSKAVVKEHDTPLTAKHNAEGLCYDSKNNRLLIALKDGEPGSTDYKGIYGFDLASKKMVDQPVLKIDLKNEAFSGMESSKKKAKPGDVIMPSGIAVHPTTGDIYITEGRKPKLLITDASGAIKKLIELDKNDFLQPEGITFSSSGELFISNEGLKQPGNILKLQLSSK